MTRFPPIALAQVEAAHPEDFELDIIFPNYSNLQGIRVPIAAPGGGASRGDYDLPRRGDWGVVVFYLDTPRTAVWLVSLPDALFNTKPKEVFKRDPRARVRYDLPGTQEIHYSNGDHEQLYPDGTLLRVTASKDGSTGNTGGRVTRTPWVVGQESPADSRQEARRTFQPSSAPVDVMLDHSSGAQGVLTADGSWRLTTAKGHQIIAHDATERDRDPKTGQITARPEEDEGKRTASRIELKTEIGHQVILKDDPQMQLDRKILVRSSIGHTFELHDKPDTDQFIRAQTAGGHLLELRDKPDEASHILAQTAGGLTLILDDATDSISIIRHGTKILLKPDGSIEVDATTVTVNATHVNLGGPGGKGVARIGDAVQAGPYTGTITAGSTTVTSV